MDYAQGDAEAVQSITAGAALKQVEEGGTQFHSSAMWGAKTSLSKYGLNGMMYQDTVPAFEFLSFRWSSDDEARVELEEGQGMSCEG